LILAQDLHAAIFVVRWRGFALVPQSAFPSSFFLCWNRQTSERFFSFNVLPFTMPYAIINSMTLRIDKAGRIILPKPVRDRLQLREGAELLLEEHPDGLILRPIEHKSPMVQEHGIWVHQGQAPPGFNWDTIVEAIRDERIRDASGL
jgi:AbrB family looped-hinge helix DNA binding protein